MPEVHHLANVSQTQGPRYFSEDVIETEAATVKEE